MMTKISELSIANPLQHFYKVKMVVSEKFLNTTMYVTYKLLIIQVSYV